MVSRCSVIRRALVSGSRTSMPDISEMCASHDDPPKVGESTKAETTRRPVSRIAVSSCDLGAVRNGAMSGRS
jgi:hypothetical protein